MCALDRRGWDDPRAASGRQRRALAARPRERARAGLYRSTEAPKTADQTLFEACAAVPEGVICLTSALAYHRLTTANPSAIEMAIPRDHWRPRVTYPPIHFYEFWPRLMHRGLEVTRRPQRRQLRVFNAERVAVGRILPL